MCYNEQPARVQPEATLIQCRVALGIKQAGQERAICPLLSECLRLSIGLAHSWHSIKTCGIKLLALFNLGKYGVCL